MKVDRVIPACQTANIVAAGLNMKIDDAIKHVAGVNLGLALAKHDRRLSGVESLLAEIQESAADLSERLGSITSSLHEINKEGEDK